MKMSRKMNREVVVSTESNVNEEINAQLEAVIQAKAEELSKKYFRNITVNFGATIK